jgi:hypothetical protein
MTRDNLDSIYQICGAADDDDDPRFRYMRLDYPDFDKSSKEVNWCEFWAGQKVSDDFGRHLRFILLESGGPILPDFRQSICGWILMSAKLRTDVESNSCGLEYQWIDPSISYPDEDSMKLDYKLFNSLTHVSCLNTDESKIELFENGSIRNIHKMCLNRSQIGRRRGIFRLAEDPQILLVTGNLYELFLTHNIAGFSAISVALI